ncbi:hypothetical protein BDY19DRAFT_909465 [Irpex rosettiformis]|uniref:Uncharacterized protein n=1 Tax=Irpex rosettiformis TaxID=378272 RepID=A0ACB8TS37_9APHY|nr:hypothetical protein BDY19DRAFT_909465 [Irpex rosettiformis]
MSIHPATPGPFNDRDADSDIIVRSSDDVDFYAHKLILKKASPVLEGMLLEPTSGDHWDKMHIITLEEDHTTVERLLRLCYPLDGPRLETLDDVSSLLDACDKYQMHGLVERLASAELIKYADTEPLRAFILASRAKVKEEVRRAAYGCLRLPLNDIIASDAPEMRYLPAVAYRSLLVYYNKCREIAASVSLGKYRWISRDMRFCWMDGMTDHSPGCGTGHYCRRVSCGTHLQEVIVPTEWWNEMMKMVTNYLSHQAPPRATRLIEEIPFPTVSSCRACGPRSGKELNQFFCLMEKEIEKEVKAVDSERPRVKESSAVVGIWRFQSAICDLTIAHRRSRRPEAKQRHPRPPDTTKPPTFIMANLDSKHPVPIIFIAPFDDEDADLIIRSADYAHFRVHKFILKKSSPVFEGMFLVPTAERSDTVRTITLEEDRTTVERLLLLCYPLGCPRLDTLDEISSLLDACDKYQMDGLAERLASAELAKFVDTDPVRAYILACRANVVQEAQRAAYGCLRLPLKDIIATTMPGMQRVSASAYRSLLVYYDNCREAAAKVSRSPYRWITIDNDYCWLSSTRFGHKAAICNFDHSAAGLVYYGIDLEHQVTPRKWWNEMMKDVATYLSHQAPPRNPRLADAIPFPKDLPCGICKACSGEELVRFFSLMEKEIEKEIKAVEFIFNPESGDYIRRGRIGGGVESEFQMITKLHAN